MPFIKKQSPIGFFNNNYLYKEIIDQLPEDFQIEFYKYNQSKIKSAKI